MKPIVALILTVALISQPVCLARDTTAQSRSATSMLVKWRDKQNQQRTTITNRRFLYNYIYENDGEYAQILLEEIQGEFYSPGEPLGSTVKIKAFHENSTKQDWEFSTKGDRGEVSDQFYKVTNFGCCDSRDTFTWFSLRNGQRQFTSNFDLIKIGESYFAYHDSYSSVVRPDEREHTNDLVGVLEFGGKIEAPQKILLRSKGGGLENLPFVLKKEKGIMTLGSAEGLFPATYESLKSEFSDKKEFNQDWLKMPDSSIKIIWTGGVEIVIPFEKDQLRFDCATYSSNFILEFSKPDHLTFQHPK